MTRSNKRFKAKTITYMPTTIQPFLEPIIDLEPSNNATLFRKLLRYYRYTLFLRGCKSLP